MTDTGSPAKPEAGGPGKTTVYLSEEPGRQVLDQVFLKVSNVRAVQEAPVRILAFRGGIACGQTSPLYHHSLSIVQRQEFARQIGRSQGNRHLQNLLAARSSKAHLQPDAAPIIQRVWGDPRSDRELIDDAIRNRSVADAKAIRNVALATGSERIQLIDILSHQGWVGPFDEAQIERLWDSFGRSGLDAARDANYELWEHCISVGAELDDIPTVQGLRSDFRRDVTFTAARYLAENHTVLHEEMRSLGISEEEGVADMPITQAQEQQMREMQQAARIVAQLQRDQEDLQRIYVGYSVETPDPDSPSPLIQPERFDPVGPPRLAPDPGDRNMLPWATVKALYDRANSIIAAVVDSYPGLYAISREGRSAQTQQFADITTPAAARAQLSPAMRRLDAHIENAQRMNRDGEINPLDLLPIHNQLFDGQPGMLGINWRSSLPRWAAEQELRSHQAQQFWIRLGLSTLSAAAFILAPFTGGASVFVTLVGLGAAGAQVAISADRYQSLSAAARTEVRSGTALVNPEQVTIAEQQLQADQVGLAIAALMVGVGLATTAAAAARGLGGRSPSLQVLMGESRYNEYAQAIRAIRTQHPELSSIPIEDLIAIRGYTAEDYAQLNLALRTGNPEMLARLQNQIQSATSGLRQLPIYRGTVTRAVSMTDEMAAPYRQVGSVITEDAFISSSARGGSYQGGGNVAFSIESTTGRSVSMIARHVSENEVLFMPGTRFRVVSVELNGRLIRLLDLGPP